jgi:MscS family membrane protein
MRKGDLESARKVLDLGALNFAVRDTEGSRRAMMLNSVLNRTEGLDLAAIPEGGRLERVTIPVRPADEAAAIGSLELTPVSPGDWRFTVETVGALPHLWQEVRDSVPIHGFATDYEAALDSAQQIRARIPRHLWREIASVEIWQWIALAILVASGWLFGRILRALVSILLRKKLGERAATSIDRLKRAISYWVAGSIWLYALPYVDLPTQPAAVLTIGAKVALTLAAIVGGIAIVDLVVHSTTERARGLVKRADSIFFPILRNFARFVVVIVAAVAFLSSLDVNVTGVIAGLGIGGLVIALAAKDSVENIFGSLTILFDMPFGIGDWVKIGPDVNGIVEEINLRSTRVRTFDDSVITVPNSNLTKAAVENFGARRQRRINLTLGISHQNELDHVLTFADKLRDYMRTHANIRQDNAYAYVTGLTDAGVSVLVQGYIMTADYEEELRIRQELVEAMARLAAETEVNLGPIHWPMAPAPEKKA